MDETILKTLITMEPLLKNTTHMFNRAQRLTSREKCFQVLGVDIIFDANYKAWVLEINACPSMLVTYEENIGPG